MPAPSTKTLFDTPSAKVWTVSELCSQVRDSLEHTFPEVWLSGEITGYKVYGQRHAYFSLKDPSSALRCVMFQYTRRYLKFEPADGDEVLVRGRMSFYEARGDAQFIVESMQSQGQGELQAAFEALKLLLQKEGLFDSKLKRPLPALPRCVALVTSLEGAAVRDFIRIAHRRNPDLHIILSPSRVQGDSAEKELLSALANVEALSKTQSIDAVVVMRGGGSMEDLWAFNSEALARKIAGFPIPVISAVGHEIDFTIADFVSDLRASTPSAAAELLIPEKSELQRTLAVATSRLFRSIQTRLNNEAFRLDRLRQSVAPREAQRFLSEYQQRLLEAEMHFSSLLGAVLSDSQSHLHELALRLAALQPAARIAQYREQLKHLAHGLALSIKSQCGRLTNHWQTQSRLLHELSPLNVLGRGYAMAHLEPEDRLIRSIGDVNVSDRINIRLSDGQLRCEVQSKTAATPAALNERSKDAPK